MTVDQCYKFIQFIARKNQTGSISPTEFAFAFNSGQRDLFNTLLGRITVAPHVALGQNERVTERLTPFKRTEQTVAVTSQIALYPTGFVAITLMTDPATGKFLQYLDDAKLTARLNSAIDPIAEANPGAFTNIASGWKIWPQSITNVKVNYYVLPPEVKWGFVPATEKYDPATSVDPLWDDGSCEEILARACTILGFSFEKQSLVQYGQTIKAEGL